VVSAEVLVSLGNWVPVVEVGGPLNEVEVLWAPLWRQAEDLVLLADHRLEVFGVHLLAHLDLVHQHCEGGKWTLLLGLLDSTQTGLARLKQVGRRIPRLLLLGLVYLVRCPCEGIYILPRLPPIDLARCLIILGPRIRKELYPDQVFKALVPVS
jgi:hypothetical protein